MGLHLSWNHQSARYWISTPNINIINIKANYNYNNYSPGTITTILIEDPAIKKARATKIIHGDVDIQPSQYVPAGDARTIKGFSYRLRAIPSPKDIIKLLILVQNRHADLQTEKATAI